ncbi:acyl carrier protein-like protein [Fomes fomentarius]|nr:acyl carrier protein-like protein [Fomes fomentarius]
MANGDTIIEHAPTREGARLGRPFPAAELTCVSSSESSSGDRVLHTLSKNTVMFRLAARNLATRNLSVASRSVVVPRLACAARSRFVPCAAFSAAAGLSKEEITTRVLDVLKTFEKVDRSKLSEKATFAEDLGLDSLDAVEVVMAVEEEFAIDIPDAEADEIKTVQQAIDYIAKTPEAH